MAQLCSLTGLVGPVPKGRWRLSWMNRRYGRNQGSFIRIKLEMPIKWMESSRPNKVRPTQYGEKVTFIVAYQTVNAAYYCRFLLHHLRPAISKKDDAWCYRTTTFFIIMQGVTSLLAVTDLLRRCKWEILEYPHYSPNMSPCDHDLFAKVKEPLRGIRYNKHKRWTYPCYHQQRWRGCWCTMPSKYLAAADK